MARRRRSSFSSVRRVRTSRRSMAAWKDRTASTVTAMVSRNARGSTRKAGSRSTRSSTGGCRNRTSRMEKAPQARELVRQI